MKQIHSLLLIIGIDLVIACTLYAQESEWQGPVPTVQGVYGITPELFTEYEVILQPDKDEPGWWAGGPSVVRDDQGIYWMACRMRTADSELGLRGYEIRILRSEDGIRFTKVHSIHREDVPIPGFERPCLRIDPHTKFFKLYACGPWQGKEWCIIKFDDAEDPTQFIPASAKPVIQPLEKLYPRDVSPTGYKDPVIIHAEGKYHGYVIGQIRGLEKTYYFTSMDGENWSPSGNPHDSLMDLSGWHDFFYPSRQYFTHGRRLPFHL